MSKQLATKISTPLSEDEKDGLGHVFYLEHVSAGSRHKCTVRKSALASFVSLANLISPLNLTVSATWVFLRVSSAIISENQIKLSYTHSLYLCCTLPFSLVLSFINLKK